MWCMRWSVLSASVFDTQLVLTLSSAPNPLLTKTCTDIFEPCTNNEFTSNFPSLERGPVFIMIFHCLGYAAPYVS